MKLKRKRKSILTCFSTPASDTEEPQPPQPTSNLVRHRQSYPMLNQLTCSAFNQIVLSEVVVDFVDVDDKSLSDIGQTQPGLLIRKVKSEKLLQASESPQPFSILETQCQLAQPEQFDEANNYEELYGENVCLNESIDSLVEGNRIQLATTDSVDSCGVGKEESNNIQTDEEQKNLYEQKRKYVITELLETEKDYVNDLKTLVEGYIQLIQDPSVIQPTGLEGKDKIVFGNIHQIYDFHKEIFSVELTRCCQNSQAVGSVFTRYERRLHMYVKYCENKPKSEFIVAEYIEYFEDIRQRLKQRLQLPDMLIKPVQRIMKYQLLLKDILKFTQRLGEDIESLEKAVEVMKIIPKAANDMMNVGRLQGFEGKITAQGMLLLQDTLEVSEQGGKAPKLDKNTAFKERRVFLFEQLIIFSEEMDKKKNTLSSPGYVFKNSIKINNMAMETLPDDPYNFTLVDRSPGSDVKITCHAKSEQMTTHWIEQIRALLDMQGDFLKALVSPIEYQKCHKDPKIDKKNSIPDIVNVITECKAKSPNHELKYSRMIPPSIVKQKRTKSNPIIKSMKIKDEGCRLKSLTENDRARSGSPCPKKSFFDGLKYSLLPFKSRSQENLEPGRTTKLQAACCCDDEDPSNNLRRQNNVMSKDQLELYINQADMKTIKDDKISRQNSTSSNFNKVNRLPETMVAPRILQALTDIRSEEGSNAIFFCRPCGQPRPLVTWFDPTNQIVENIAGQSTITYFDDGLARLEIHNVSKEDSGIYTCQVTNDAGQTSCSANLTVLHSPIISRF